MLNIFY